MMVANEYKIEKIDDILKIPSDRQVVFFKELAEHIKNITESRELIAQLLPEGESIDEIMKMGSMTWIDDGEQYIETNIRISNKKTSK
ncbi:MAG: hypothetical protein ACTH58_04835 [Marinomonas foliarum]|uniref:hypothetical protein n=1 Tax=Marinomonas foliarum TaxID=491950 RepID=UPI003F956229